MKRPATDHAQRIAELHADLTDRIQELTSGEDWTTYLETARRFHRYSPQNQLLLALQGAEGHVASYRNWQRIPAQDGRPCQVDKGEAGLMILAPVVARVVDVDDDTGDESIARRLRGFRTVKVFHEGQLVSPPDIPEPELPTLLTGDDRWQHVWGAVTAGLTERGFDVELHSRAPDETWNGVTIFTERTVKIGDTLEAPQRLKTLLHEWAHVELGHEHRRDVARAVREVEAESVAYLVAQTVGLDAAEYTIPYVAGWSSGDIALVESTATTVLATSKQIVDELQQRLGVDLAPEILDHATPTEPTELHVAHDRPYEHPSGPEVDRGQQTTETASPFDGANTLPLDIEPPARVREPYASADDRAFIQGVIVNLEPAAAERFIGFIHRPDHAADAANVLADAGFNADQTARALRAVKVNDEQIRAALLAPVNDPERSTLYTHAEVATALDDRPILDPAVNADLASDNARLLRRTIHHAEPDRVAAMAYALGVDTHEAIAICALETADPQTTLAVATALRKGDIARALEDVTSVWPEPTEGWDRHVPSQMLAATNRPASRYAKSQAILDQWAAMRPAPQQSIPPPPH